MPIVYNFDYTNERDINQKTKTHIKVALRK